jgi:hypothetical protein
MRPFHRRCLLESAIYVRTENTALRTLVKERRLKTEADVPVTRWQVYHARPAGTACKAIDLQV